MVLLAWCTALGSVEPLTDLRYDVVVSGPLADVELTQTFRNTASVPVNATYLLPLAEGAVVDRMAIRVDDQTIAGQVDAIERAQQAYDQAVREGRTAALVAPTRWDRFRQQVGNIPPGAVVELTLRVVQPVPRRDGRYELVLPLATGARFVPDGLSEDEALAAPPSPSGARAQIRVAVDGAVPLRGVEVLSHPAFVAPTGEGWTLHARDLSLESDFVARWTAAGDAPQVGALHDGEHLLLVFEPPADRPYPQRRPRELILLVDPPALFGPQRGQVLAALERALLGLDPVDRLALALPGDAVRPQPATPDLVQAQLGRLRANPGRARLDVHQALRHALDRPADPERARYALLVSDGVLPDPDALFAWLSATPPAGRLHVLGAGPAVDRFVLAELAALGGGSTTWLRAQDAVDPDLLGALDRPVLSEVAVDWGDWGPLHIAPSRLPEVHLGRPARVLARTRREEGGPLVVTGLLGAEPIALRVIPRRVERGRAIASAWARARIEDLGRQQVLTGVPARDEGLPLALDYGIASPWTAFIAIDPRDRSLTGPWPAEPEEPDEPAPQSGVAMAPIGGVLGSRSSRADQALHSEAQRAPAPPWQTGTVADLHLIGGATDGLARSEARVGLGGRGPGPLAGALDLGLAQRAVRGGSWTDLRGLGTLRYGDPGAARALELTVEGGAQRTDAPTAATVELSRRALALGLRAQAPGAEAEAGAEVQELAGGLGVGAQRRGVHASGRTDLGDRRERLELGLRARAGRLLTAEAARRTAAVGARLGAVHEGPVWVARGGLWADGVWVDGALRPVLAPDLRIERARGGLRLHGELAREVDLRAPELALPTRTGAWLGATLGEPEAPVLLGLRTGWERAEGPLALDPRRLTTLPDDLRWRRDAWITELTLRVLPPTPWADLGLRVRHTGLLRADAAAAGGLAPWVPGLLLAHRPLFASLDGKIQLAHGRWTTELRAEGSLASPLPGRAGDVWAGWQGLGRLGVHERVPVRAGALRVGAELELRRGRPEDPRHDAVDGWLAPDRLGGLALLGVLSVHPR